MYQNAHKEEEVEQLVGPVRCALDGPGGTNAAPGDSEA